MKLTAVALAATAILACCGFTLAEGNDGQPPTQQMQQTGSEKGPGTSGYSPGHEMNEQGGGKKKQEGASGDAPGKGTTGRSESEEREHILRTR